MNTETFPKEVLTDDTSLLVCVLHVCVCIAAFG